MSPLDSDLLNALNFDSVDQSRRPPSSPALSTFTLSLPSTTWRERDPADTMLTDEVDMPDAVSERTTEWQNSIDGYSLSSVQSATSYAISYETALSATSDVASYFTLQLAADPWLSRQEQSSIRRSPSVSSSDTARTPSLSHSSVAASEETASSAESDVASYVTLPVTHNIAIPRPQDSPPFDTAEEKTESSPPVLQNVPKHRFGGRWDPFKSLLAGLVKDGDSNLVKVSTAPHPIT